MRRRVSNLTPHAPALARLGLATPPPFVGRVSELDRMDLGLERHGAVVVRGAVGSGKTQLALTCKGRQELAGVEVAWVRCWAGERAQAIASRAERALRCRSGQLHSALQERRCLVIIDDAHNLRADEAERFYSELCSGLGHGRVLLMSRDALPIWREIDRDEWALEGLDEPSAFELWSHLQETYGPTPAAAWDSALTRTRGMPLALRKAYALAAFGDDAWSLDELSPVARAALEAVSVIRFPVGPAGVAAISGVREIESALIDLVSRQLVDPLSSGRFAIHDVVRDEVLQAIGADRRGELEARVADVLDSSGRGETGCPRLAWDAGDDGAIEPMDAVDRMCESVRHRAQCGDREAAIERLLRDRGAAVGSGAGAEIIALTRDLEDHLGDRGGELARLRAEIQARAGHVAAALDEEADLSPVTTATLYFRAGEVHRAVGALEERIVSGEVDERCLAAATLAEIQLMRARADQARRSATAAFERDRGHMSTEARARLHLALAAVEAADGNSTSARAALSRAASAAESDPTLTVEIEVRRAEILCRDGRLNEASEVAVRALRTAAHVDVARLEDGADHVLALVESRRGDASDACERLRAISERRRRAGDVVGAACIDLDRARILVTCGELAAAAACLSGCEVRVLEAMARDADALLATIAIKERRLADAESLLASIGGEASSDDVCRARAMLAAARGEATGQDDASELFRAELASLRGDSAGCLGAAAAAASSAERRGEIGEIARAMALLARYHLARGERRDALATATRAARESLASGMSEARAEALLALASLSREGGAQPRAATYARDALEIAAASALPIQRLVAVRALEVIADGAASEGAASEVPLSATMTPEGKLAAEQTLTDLGLTAARPYLCVDARGESSRVADASPDPLRFAERDLVIDAVREAVVRRGEQTVDLRRRSLLKRLLFLLAKNPGKVFSKENIVETVWGVEYHPLRHDAALFTNIMRIRRLLGDDGSELIRVSEDGYRLVPETDFLYVERVDE